MINRNSKISLCLVLFALAIVMVSSCESIDNPTPQPPKTVYCFYEGRDYTNNVYVLFDSQRERIIGIPSYDDLKYDTITQTIDYYKGYYFGVGFYGAQTAFLDITIEDFQNIDDTITERGFYDHLIDKNPFKEYYSDDDGYLNNHCPECIEKDTICPAFDTIKFHRLVDDNVLAIHLYRII